MNDEGHAPAGPRVLMEQLYGMMLQSQRWPEARLRAHQRNQLEQLVTFARAETPFYRSRLDVLFRPDGAIDWDRWSEVPILRRSDLIAHGEAMRPEGLPAGHGRRFFGQTSGTTGERLTVASNELADFAHSVALARAQGWYELDWSQPFVNWDVNAVDRALWPKGEAHGPWGPPWIAGSAAGRRFALNRATPRDKVLEFVERQGARYLGAGADELEALADLALRSGVRPRLDAVLTRGTGPSPAVQALYREAFGARTLALYSSTEGHKMALPCPEAGTYHVFAEVTLVEIVDEDGKPCAPGETGRVLVTPFYSTAQPLIRYEQGDLATVGGICSCGRTLPAIAAVEGRVRPTFRLPGGAVVAPVLPRAYLPVLDARRWQVAQTAPLAFELRYVPRDPAETGDEDRVVEVLRGLIGHGAQVRAVRVAELKREPDGKLVEHICEI